MFHLRIYPNLKRKITINITNPAPTYCCLIVVVYSPPFPERWIEMARQIPRGAP